MKVAFCIRENHEMGRASALVRCHRDSGNITAASILLLSLKSASNTKDMLHWQTCQLILLSHLVNSQMASSAINNDIAISQFSFYPSNFVFFRSLDSHRVYPCFLSMAIQWSILFPLMR